jgi:hypothetical protein
MKSLEKGLEHGRVTGSITCSSYQWFQYGRSLHFVVVAAHDLFFGGDGGMAQEGEEGR